MCIGGVAHKGISPPLFQAEEDRSQKLGLGKGGDRHCSEDR